MKIFDKIDGYNQWYDMESGEWNCDCIFGSFFRFGEFWKKKKTICRHVKWLLKKNNIKKEE